MLHKQEIDDLHERFSERGIIKQRLQKLVRSLTWIFVVQTLSTLKRIVDIFFALLLMSLFSPILIVMLAVSFFRRIIYSIPRLGRWGVMFKEYKMHIPKNRLGKVFLLLRIHRLPVLFNIIKGDMSFVGPRLISPHNLSLHDEKARRRCSVRPGLISLWWIRKRANIHYEDELDTDMEYVKSQSLKSDIGIALRAIPAILYGEGAQISSDYINIFGINIHNVTMDTALDSIMELLDSQQKHQISFVNPDCANIAYKNKTYYQILQESSVVLGDGIGIKIAGKILGNEIKQNVNGTDMFPRLCQKLAGKNAGIFLLGARDGITKDVANWVANNCSSTLVKGYQHGYFSAEEEQEVIQKINATNSEVIFVAFGAPRQEEWIYKNLQQLNVKVAIGVGGLFDFYSGRMERAPQWVRELGMEWAFRLCKEPRRLWKRYVVGNFVFLYRVIKQKFGVSV